MIQIVQIKPCRKVIISHRNHDVASKDSYDGRYQPCNHPESRQSFHIDMPALTWQAEPDPQNKRQGAEKDQDHCNTSKMLKIMIAAPKNVKSIGRKILFSFATSLSATKNTTKPTRRSMIAIMS
jgi:hypothetical protein